jgi:hypothetical protein
MRLQLAIPALILSILLSHVAFALTITLPEETAEYRVGSGVDLARSYCMGCHSADYVLTQPPGMSRSFWEAEVNKMKKAFGAPLPDDQVTPLVDYLVRTYSVL